MSLGPFTILLLAIVLVNFTSELVEASYYGRAMSFKKASVRSLLFTIVAVTINGLFLIFDSSYHTSVIIVFLSVGVLYCLIRMLVSIKKKERHTWIYPLICVYLCVLCLIIYE
ncbi:hypothetical protein [Pontibacillus halophilus]|uniref:hypothetical protein n=1 Tax=Pontibacillus halophilus TaxID=516704 RepID=UPI00042793EC|nr:hypothetical protein [Pontibacillus halophilus]